MSEQTNETTTENTAGAAEQPKEKTPGVGDLAKDLIRKGLGNKEVLEGVKAQFPDAKTSMASINWYRNNLRSEGEDVKTAREISAAGKADEIAAKKEAKEKEKAEKKAAKEKEKAEKKAAADAKKAEEKAKKEQAKKDKEANANAGSDSSTADAASMLQ